MKLWLPSPEIRVSWYMSDDKPVGVDGISEDWQYVRADERVYSAHVRVPRDGRR